MKRDEIKKMLRVRQNTNWFTCYVCVYNKKTLCHLQVFSTARKWQEREPELHTYIKIIVQNKHLGGLVYVPLVSGNQDGISGCNVFCSPIRGGVLQILGAITYYCSNRGILKY